MRLLSDEGSATITATGIITSVVSLALAVVALGVHTSDTHRTRVAARRTAELNGARVVSCEVTAGDVVVAATRRRAEAAARAGP